MATQRKTIYPLTGKDLGKNGVAERTRESTGRAVLEWDKTKIQKSFLGNEELGMQNCGPAKTFRLTFTQQPKKVEHFR